MCTLYPRYNSCCGIPVRIALIFIAILSIVTGAIINAMLKKAGINVSSIQDVKILKNYTGIKLHESNDTLLSSRRENEYIDMYEDVVETSSWKSRRAQYKETTSKEEFATIEIVGEDGQIEVIRFLDDDPESANALSDAADDGTDDNDQGDITPPPQRPTTTATTKGENLSTTGEGADTTEEEAGTTRPPHGSTTKTEKGAGTTRPPYGSTTKTEKGAGTTRPPHGSTTKTEKGAGTTRPPHGSTTKIEKGAGTTGPPHGNSTKKGAGSTPKSERRTTAEEASTTTEGDGTTTEGEGTTTEGEGTTTEGSEEQGGGSQEGGGSGESTQASTTPASSGESTPGESTPVESEETTTEDPGETTTPGDSTEATGVSRTTKLPKSKSKKPKKKTTSKGNQIFKAVGYVNRNGLNVLAMMFIALGILLLVANFLNSPDLALLYVVLLIATVIAALLLLVGVVTECSTYHDICILKNMDWFSSFMVTIFWFIYIFVWAFFAAVANTFANGGVGISLL